MSVSTYYSINLRYVWFILCRYILKYVKITEILVNSGFPAAQSCSWCLSKETYFTPFESCFRVDIDGISTCRAKLLYGLNRASLCNFYCTKTKILLNFIKPPFFVKSGPHEYFKKVSQGPKMLIYDLNSKPCLPN